MSAASFSKRQREKERKERAAAKVAKRAERRAASDDDAPAATDAGDEAAVLAELAALHARFEAGDIEFEDFAEARQVLTERLHIT